MSAPRALALVVVAGCSLLGSKSTPVEVHYFSPPTVATTPGPGEQPRCTARLKLGRITAADHLETRIAHRESPVELGLYETLRWTEPPDNYVRRSLARQLFEVRGLEESTSGRDPRLDVELLGFEEVRSGSHHAGRVQLAYELRDRDSVIARGQITKEREVRASDISEVIAAIGAAMTEASSELAGRVADSLCAGSARPETAPQTSRSDNPR